MLQLAQSATRGEFVCIADVKTRLPSVTHLNTPDELTVLISEEKSGTYIIDEEVKEVFQCDVLKESWPISVKNGSFVTRVEAADKEKSMYRKSLKKGFVYNEIKALIKLSHKHIISLGGVIQTKQKIELLFPNAGESLYSIRRNRSSPSPMFLDVMSQLYLLWLQLLSAVRHLGKKGWCHLDIKPGNIVVRFTARGIIHGTLIDLGSSRYLEDGLGFGCHGGFTHPYMSHCQWDYIEIAKAKPPVGECDSWIQGLIDKESDEYSLALSFYSFVHGVDKMMEAHSQIKPDAPDNEVLDGNIRAITAFIPEEYKDRMFSQIKSCLTYRDLSDLKLKISGKISAQKRKTTRKSRGSRGRVWGSRGRVWGSRGRVWGSRGRVWGSRGRVWTIGCEYDMRSILKNRMKEVQAHDPVPVNEIRDQVASGGHDSSGCHRAGNTPGIMTDEGGGVNGITDDVPRYERLEYRNLPNFDKLGLE